MTFLTDITINERKVCIHRQNENCTKSGSLFPACVCMPYLLSIWIPTDKHNFLFTPTVPRHTDIWINLTDIPCQMPGHSSSLGYQYAVHVLLARVQHTMQVVQDIWSCISWLYDSFHNTIKWGISEQYKFLYIIIACKVTVKLSHINWVPCVTLDTHIFGNQCTLAFIVLPAMYESEDSAAQGQVHKRC